jgi:hypothetical protein
MPAVSKPPPVQIGGNARFVQVESRSHNVSGCIRWSRSRPLDGALASCAVRAGCAGRAVSVGAWRRRWRGTMSSPSGTSSGSATRTRVRSFAFGHPVPPGDSAPLTIGLSHRQQAARTRAGFPCSARVRHGWGRVPSLPRGLRCLRGQVISLAAAPRLPAAGPYSPRHSTPPRDVNVTRHQRGFTGVHPSQPFPHL